MTPAPGVRISGIHSTMISEDEQAISLWLDMSDGSIASIHFNISDVLAQAFIIQESERAPDGMRLQ